MVSNFTWSCNEVLESLCYGVTSIKILITVYTVKKKVSRRHFYRTLLTGRFKSQSKDAILGNF
jgi:hypothetical protein